MNPTLPLMVQVW